MTYKLERNLKAKIKKVIKMTGDGLTEENLRDGSVIDISLTESRTMENKEKFVPERERKRLRMKIQNQEKENNCRWKRSEIFVQLAGSC